MKKLLIAALLIAGYVGYTYNGSAPWADCVEFGSAGNQTLVGAFESRRSGLQVEGEGMVIRLPSHRQNVGGAVSFPFILSALHK